MDQAYRDVFAFHEKFGCAIGTTPAVPDDDTVDLRWELIEEEINELDCAIGDNDLPAIADAIGDAIYVLIGTAIAYGIDLRPVWRAIHEANIAKVGGGKRADGKCQKPPGWVAPDIAGILARQTGAAS